MSALCPQSASLLSFTDEDIRQLKRKSPEGLRIRSISTTMNLRTTYNKSTNRSGEFASQEPQYDATALCGICSFCTMVTRAVQNLFISPDSNGWAWDLSSTHPFKDENTDVVVAIVLSYMRWECDFKAYSEWADELSSGLEAVNLEGFASIYALSRPETETLWLRHGLAVRFDISTAGHDLLASLLAAHRRTISAEPLSSANLRRLKGWLADCDDHHDICWSDLHGAIGELFLPSRLLFVGNSDDEETPRLVTTKHLPRIPERESTNKLRYIALSYCWGLPSEAARMLKTTSSTIVENQKCIPTTSMPQTFRDAITVARSLHISYLWIDCLCIIQDSSSDWQIESSYMADIFSNAYLTIAVATGSSAQHSFLTREVPSQCSIPVKWQDDVNQRNGLYELRSRRPWGTEKMAAIIECRWVTRGWTFQEERLARRILTFGTKFFLDCRSIERIEDTERYRFRPDWVDSISGIGASAQRVVKYKGQSRSTLEHWQTLCGHYSNRELTFASDKLPAISGVASKFSMKVKSPYLAGLWQAHLPHDLLWYVPVPGTRPPTYRAPSWSWAALDGKIDWPRWGSCTIEQCHLYASILSAESTTNGLDPFGTVSSGHLTISGPVLEVEASVHSSEDNVLPEEENAAYTWRLSVGDVEVARATPDSEDLYDGQAKRYFALLFSRCDDYAKISLGNGEYRYAQCVDRGLLLQSMGQERDGVPLYQRIGLFYVPASFEDMRQFWTDDELKTVTII